VTQVLKTPARRNRGGDGLYHRKGRGWYAVVEYPKKNGVRDRRWFGPHKTSDDAKIVRDQHRNKVADGEDINPRKSTFGEFLDRWIAYQQSKQRPVRPRTLEGYKSVVETRLRPRLGDVKLSEVTAMKLAEMVASWSSGKRLDGKKGSVSSRSIAAYARVLRMALRQAASWSLVSDKLAKSVGSPRLERRKPSFVSIADLPAVSEAARAAGIYAPVAAALGLGLRRGELLGLQWRDVNLDEGSVRVERAVQRVNGALVTVPPKTEESNRHLSAPRFVIDALREHRAAIASLRISAGLGRIPDDHFVFAYPNGGALDPDSFGKRFVKAMKAAGIDVHLHSLRHGFAVLSLEAGTDLKVVSASLGHSTIKLTADTYSHVTAKLQRQASDRLDILLDDAEKRAVRVVG
jgi:integrase